MWRAAVPAAPRRSVGTWVLFLAVSRSARAVQMRHGVPRAWIEGVLSEIDVEMNVVITLDESRFAVGKEHHLGRYPTLAELTIVVELDLVHLGRISVWLKQP